MNSKKFEKKATDIRYYGEWNLKWWQRFFYNPPKEVYCGIANTRGKAHNLKPKPHKQFGLTFAVMSHTSHVHKLRR